MGILVSTLSLIISSFVWINSEELRVNNYIDSHMEIAVSEMYRSGIPASITMAQAIHESKTGQSELAIYANNHFGIKCKKYWKGQTYYYKDDDRDIEGRLIESCFRAYETVVDSYIDHSNFLMQTAHYRPLFDIPVKDYKSWATGLKKAGYATDPLYADKLIGIIEKYDLTLLDYHPDPLQKFKNPTGNN